VDYPCAQNAQGWHTRLARLFEYLSTSWNTNYLGALTPPLAEVTFEFAADFLPGSMCAWAARKSSGPNFHYHPDHRLRT
jgi:hypothetical protein